MLAARLTTTTASWGPLSMAEPLVGAPIDANGNLTTDGTRTFEWDARNQLVAVTVGTHRSELAYDGQQRLVRKVTKSAGVTISDLHQLWCGAEMCETRTAGTGHVTRRVLSGGEQRPGTEPMFFAPDHLGSIRSATNSAAGSLAQYGYDPWGRAEVLSGQDVSPFGFTGHARADFGLLTHFRVYDPETARWLSRDPLELRAGPNTYRYVDNRPVFDMDPLGLAGVNGEGQGGGQACLMVGIGGGCGSGGLIVDTSGQVCAYVGFCIRLGFGYFAGAGGFLGLGANTQSPQSGWSCSIGAGGDIGYGPSVGGAVAVSGTSAGVGKGKGGVGYGFSLGVDLCCNRLKCRRDPCP